MGAAAVVWCGLTLPWTGSPPVNMAITLFWLIGITNAVNLLDNMDGLAAGIAAIASTFLRLTFLGNAQAAEALMLAVFGAGLRWIPGVQFEPGVHLHGRLRLDVHRLLPGRLGALELHRRAFAQLLPVLAVPVLILFIWIFDTLLVTILRKLAGRSVARGAATTRRTGSWRRACRSATPSGCSTYWPRCRASWVCSSATWRRTTAWRPSSASCSC